MPVIFHPTAAGWRTLPVAAPRGVLSLDPVGFVPGEVERPASPNSLVLMRVDGERRWAGLIPEGMRLLHNGQRAAAGLRILAHRDALAIPGGRAVFFSTEETARVELFEGSGEVTCPRCRAAVHAGDPAVRCPDCGVVHHQGDERDCWTYAETCALCSRPSAMDSGLRWTPEAL